MNLFQITASSLESQLSLEPWESGTWGALVKCQMGAGVTALFYSALLVILQALLSISLTNHARQIKTQPVVNRWKFVTLNLS